MHEPTVDDPVEACTERLRRISGALHAFRQDHGELPGHLSELYPAYLAEEQLLHCPADASPGNTRFGSVAYPQLPISYLYPLNTDVWPFPLEELGPQRP